MELKDIFYNEFSEELKSKIKCLSEDGNEIDFLSNERIETIAFDEKENISIMFFGYQTSIFIYEKEWMFMDDNSKGSYTLSDVYNNIVYEGNMRELSHEQMLKMFAEIILCFINVKDIQVEELDVPKEKNYKSYKYFEPHMYVINTKTDNPLEVTKIYENITINL